MNQYSFLSESRKKFIKRLLRYTPEERKRIVDTLIQNGRHGINKNNAYMKGMYSADEYGKKAFEGQKTRIMKMAERSGNKKLRIKDRVGHDVIQGENYGPNEISLPAITNPLSPRFSPKLKGEESFESYLKNATKNPKTISDTSKQTYGKNLDGTYFKRIKKAVTKPNDKVSIPLTGYTVAKHEADEHAAALMLSKKTGLSFDDAVNKIREIQQKSLGNGKKQIGAHNPGVLKKERDLYRQLSLMYGRDSFFRIPRSKVEYRVNKQNI